MDPGQIQIQMRKSWVEIVFHHEDFFIHHGVIVIHGGVIVILSWIHGVTVIHRGVLVTVSCYMRVNDQISYTVSDDMMYPLICLPQHH